MNPDNIFFSSITGGNVNAFKIRPKVLEVDGVEIKNNRGPQGPEGPTGPKGNSGTSGKAGPKGPFIVSFGCDSGTPSESDIYLFVNGLSTTLGSTTSTMDTTFLSPVTCLKVLLSLSRENGDEIADWKIIVGQSERDVQMLKDEKIKNQEITLKGDTKFQVSISSTGNCGGVIARLCLFAE